MLDPTLSRHHYTDTNVLPSRGSGVITDVKIYLSKENVAVIQNSRNLECFWLEVKISFYN